MNAKTRSLPSMAARPIGPPPARSGLTLSEVLAATLIMSIGVVSLATLFPIALLRSVQATQLTHATLLRQNAEARIEFDPNVVHDPDGGGARTESNYRADIDLNSNNTIDAGDTDWDSDNAVDTGAYLVDPIGLALANTPNTLGGLTRFSGFGTTTPSVAQFEALCMLPDVWQPVFSSQVVATSGSPSFDITVPTSIDLSNIDPRTSALANLNKPRYRMILLDATGKTAVIKNVFTVDTANSKLSWLDSSGPTPTGLPSGFSPVNVRVEVQERRYTWMLTVRKNSAGTAALDVVTFFERSFRPQDEFVYGNPPNATTNATYSVNNTGQATGTGYDGQNGVAGVDDDGDGTTDTDVDERGWPGSDDRRTITVTWDGSTGGDPTPFLKNGSFLLDTVGGNWYRIVQYNEAVGTASIVVDRDLVPLPSGRTPQLVFYRGVLEVYPVGSRMVP